jgi:RNA polymerase sigma-70 factor (ECF subfamily)
MKTKISKSEVMKRAWKLFNNQSVRTDEMFSECLKKSWSIAKSFDFEATYKRYYAGLLNTMKLKTNNSMDAEEIVNDTFQRLLETMHLFDASRGNIGSFIYGIANNIAIDYFRKNVKHQRNVSISDYTDEMGREYLPIADDNSADELAESNEQSEQIKAIINNTLTEKQRKVAELYFMKEYSYKEIEAEMGISMSDVKVTIRRVRIALQNAMAKANLTY